MVSAAIRLRFATHAAKTSAPADQRDEEVEQKTVYRQHA